MCAITCHLLLFIGFNKLCLFLDIVIFAVVLKLEENC